MSNETAIAELNKVATALKRDGDMKGAIAALRRVKVLSGKAYAETRLAKFLQEAGNTEQALKEIDWLLNHSHAWAKAMFGHQPESIMERQRLGWCSRIHADAVLICKRAKRPDLQAMHEQERELMRLEIDAITPQAVADKEARRVAWETAKLGGAAGITAFFKGRKP